eukprot:619481-Rhodomonas_salina.1
MQFPGYPVPGTRGNVIFQWVPGYPGITIRIPAHATVGTSHCHRRLYQLALDGDREASVL